MMVVAALFSLSTFSSMLCYGQGSFRAALMTSSKRFRLALILLGELDAKHSYKVACRARQAFLACVRLQQAADEVEIEVNRRQSVSSILLQQHFP